MSEVQVEENLPPAAHVTISFLGPVAPHWEMHRHFGDTKFLDDFWGRVGARLLLLPKHDPQFRRNRERVNRDAERERIVCSWDLGEDDEETVLIDPASLVEQESETVETESTEEENSEVEDNEEEQQVEATGSEESAEEA